jgi:Trk K+ transport system NAD-binding subunit
MLRLDLAKEAKRYAKEKGYHETDKRIAKGLPVVRGYEIEEGAEFLGKTRVELEARRDLMLAVVRLKRGKKTIKLGPDDEVAVGDRVAVMAPPDVHAQLRELPGVKMGILDPELLESSVTSADVIVTREAAVGRPISDLRAPEEFGCFVTHVRRAQIQLPAEGSTVLQKGDVLTLVGNSEQLEDLAAVVGEIERDVVETDLVSFALGISGGLLLGKISIKFGAIAVGIGSAGGLLLMGILLGFLRSLSPTFGRVPPAARFVLMELGLMFFMVNGGSLGRRRGCRSARLGRPRGHSVRRRGADDTRYPGISFRHLRAQAQSGRVTGRAHRCHDQHTGPNGCAGSSQKLYAGARLCRHLRLRQCPADSGRNDHHDALAGLTLGTPERLIFGAWPPAGPSPNG